MKKYTFVLFVLLLCCVNLMAQHADDIVITVGKKNITRGELEYVYKKNNEGQKESVTLEEYADLYRKFQLKVVAAEIAGFDTIKGFVKEYNSYRADIVKPYLKDQHVEDSLYAEAKARLMEDVEIQQIFLLLPDNYTPQDTLAVYKKALIVRERAKKEDFSKLALEVSDDPNVDHTHGVLGWFTGSMAVYPFECAMYNTPVGQVSQPVRVGNGYYLVKVLNRTQAHGQIRCSHILVRNDSTMSTAQHSAALDKIDKALKRIESGESFEDVAKGMSEDPGSAARGGDLNWFGVGRMVRDFENVAFSLKKVGDISGIIQTEFGYHIIKLTGRKTVDVEDAEQFETIKRSMQYDGRVQMAQASLVQQLKKEYNFTYSTKVWDSLASILLSGEIDNSIVAKSKKITDPFAIWNGGRLKPSEFADYVGENASGKLTMNELLNLRTQYEISKLIVYEDTQLERKYPELRYLLKEYRDGMLLFAITSREVWDKATQDTQGLKQYFEENKDKYSFDAPRYKGRICCCRDKQVAKTFRKMLSMVPSDSVNKYVIERMNTDSVKYVETFKGLWKEGENLTIDRLVFKKNVPENRHLPSDLPVVFVYGKIIKSPQEYSDIRGAVIADYQTYLEKEWMKTLEREIPSSITLK